MRKNLRSKSIGLIATAAFLASASITPAVADAAKPGQSMTHIKTVSGITSTLEGAGVIMYVQGGATAAIIGDSISDPESKMVFHIPITGTKTGIEHVGSNIVFFNTANNKIVQLRNPLINLKNGVVNAGIPQADSQSMAALTITNASELKPKVTNDKRAKLRTSAYAGAKLSLAPGIGAALTSLLGLPEGTIPEGLEFATADVTLYSKTTGK